MSNAKTTFLSAIEHDDRQAVCDLLQADPSLAKFSIAQPHLYQTTLLHWIYAGDTPLHLAAAGYRVEIVVSLLAAGADPNASHNHRESTPLHYAADTCLESQAWTPARQVATIQALLKAGAKLNAPDKNGATPLHRAVRTRGAEAVNCLLEAGCDPRLRNEPGSTPFHLAVQNTGRGGSGSSAAKAAQREIIKCFLSLGISPNLKDGQGKSIVECAKSDWVREMLGG